MPASLSANAPVEASPSIWQRRAAMCVSLVTLLVALPASAGFAARWFWLCELACHFRAQYFWSLLLGTALLAAMRRWRSATLAGILATIHIPFLWPLYVPQGPTREITLLAGAEYPTSLASSEELRRPDALRLVSMNVQAANHSYDKVERFVRESDPDLAVFLELDESWANALSRLEDNWPHARYRTGLGNFSIGLVSRIPLEEVRIEFLGERCAAIVATLLVSGETLTVIGTHPYPPMSPDVRAMRDGQLAGLGDLVLAQKETHVVVLGDLNTTSWSPGFVDLIEKTGLIDSRLGLGVQPSWHAKLPAIFRIPIDHCLVSSGVEVLSRRVGEEVGSDHLPVIVELRLGR